MSAGAAVFEAIADAAISIADFAYRYEKGVLRRVLYELLPDGRWTLPGNVRGKVHEWSAIGAEEV